MSDGLDQFFTPEATALRCWAWLLAQPGLDDRKNIYCEPSAGRGAFFRLLPNGRRLGFEIDPELAGRMNIGPADFLAIDELPGLAPLVVVGNPPFGFRGATALKFINHSFALGAKYVAFILPGAFRPAMAVPASCDSYVEVFHIDRRGTGLHRVNDTDLFLPQSSPHGSAMKNGIKPAAALLPNTTQIGVKILRDHDRVRQHLINYNWLDAAQISSNQNRQINIPQVRAAIIAGGFIDDGGEPGEPVLEPPVIEKRIKGGHSIAFLPVPANFELPEGEEGNKDISGCAFVLYKRGSRPRGSLFEDPSKPSCESFAKVYTIWRSPPTGLDKIDRCSVFIDRRGYKKIEARDAPTEAMLKNNCYGVELLRSKDELKKHLLDYDWTAAAKVNPASGRNINKSSVLRAIIEGGFVDEKEILEAPGEA